MRDLKERFRTLDRVPAPDLWTNIERRDPADLSLGPSRGRIGVAAVALVVAAAGIAIAVRAFVREPVGPATEPVPIVPKANGMLAFVGGERPVSPFGSSPIYVVNPSGNRIKRLSKGSWRDTQPAWSPDGTRIVFVRTGGEFPPNDIYVINVDGSGLRRLSSVDQYQNSPTWSPDGKRIAFSRGGSNTDYDLYVMDTDGGHVVQLTDGRGNELEPHWSPDGTSIVYAASTQQDQAVTDLFLVRADGTDVRQLTKTASFELSPRWSPDGKRIAFVRAGGQGQLASIEVMNVETESEGALFNCIDCLLDVSWSPDGTKIVFSRFRNSAWGVWAMNADGTDVHRIDTGSLQACCASWQPIPK